MAGATAVHRRPRAFAFVLAASAATLAGYAAPSFVHARQSSAQVPPARASTATPRVQQPRMSAGFGAAMAATAFAGLAVTAARKPRTAMRALQEVGSVKLNLIGGKATPAPPVGPALGAFGVNIAMFVKEYNALTSDKAGEVCPVILHVMSDKSFTLELKTPPTAFLVHKAVGKDRGSGRAGTDIIGKIDIDKLREIATIKLPDLNCEDVERAMKIIHGTCVASGVEVEGYSEWLASIFPPPATILDRYGPSKKNLPAPWGEGPPLDGAVPAEETKVAEEA